MSEKRVTPARKEVMESSLELLLIEIVRWFVYGWKNGRDPQKTDAGNGSADVDQIAGSLNRKLALTNAVHGMGYDVGQRLIERLSTDHLKMETNLEVVKYICKDFWEETFKKQIDVLKTNNKGRFVLQDNNFRWIRKASRNDPSQLKVEDFLTFPAGIVCGAMNRLGVDCTVSADAASAPMCIFTVEIAQPPNNSRQQ
ncbi:hypothetical protein NDN08_000746 [Rhodosorus marinus]|uniref:Trafficking protein particle complex subunit n=1 Tax=Rhodosorus marinus TaxID=101924 RepID=A0AAV8UNZ6_9RHOD|nr:hypothetical protein NDN08_000746 [Rhodosorus marinus]